MHLTLTPKNLLAFLALFFVCHELHELIHILVAYLQCGCWGDRDFVGWRICEACPPGVSTTFIFSVGPLLSYGLIWIGFMLMSSKRPTKQQVLGWALLFANNPVGRILPVLDREGDESLITRNLINKTTMTVLSWSTEIAVVFLLTLPVLIRAWRLLHPDQRVFAFASFLALPLLADAVLLNTFANQLLKKGFLAGTQFLGSPVLVHIWNFGWLLVLIFWFRQLYTLLSPEETAPGLSGK